MKFSNGERRVGDNVWFSAEASSKASKTSSLLAKNKQILMEHSNCLAAPLPPPPPGRLNSGYAQMAHNLLYYQNTTQPDNLSGTSAEQFN